LTPLRSTKRKWLQKQRQKLKPELLPKKKPDDRLISHTRRNLRLKLLEKQ